MTVHANTSNTDHHNHHHSPTHCHHTHCHAPLDIDTKMQEAYAICQARHARFTALRQDIYRLILQANKPLGAYELIGALEQKRHNEPITHHQATTKNTATKIAPPTIYRSLDFLLSFGLIHQLNSLNAYIACCHPKQAHIAAFLICQSCHKVQELHSLPVSEIIDYSQQQLGFLVQKSTIELAGVCHDCRT